MRCSLCGSGQLCSCTNQEYQEAISKLREMGEFYAACSNWGWESVDQQDEGYDYIKNDEEIDGECGVSSGRRARATLKEVFGDWE